MFEQQPDEAVPPLRKLVVNGERPEGRVRALYALASLERLTADSLAWALKDPHPQVRRHAVRLSEPFADDVPELRMQLSKMINDDSIHVRYQLAFSLGEWSTADRLRALAEMTRDAEDIYIQTAIQSSLAKGAGAVLTVLVEDPAWCFSVAGNRMLESLSSQIGRQQTKADITAVTNLAPRLLANHPILLARILGNLRPRPGTSLANEMTDGALAKVVEKTVAEARRIAADPNVNVDERIPAIEAIGLGAIRSDTLHDEQIFIDLLSVYQPLPVQEAALQALTLFPTDDVADVLIKQWGQLGPQIRRQATDRMLSRHAWQAKLLEAIRSERILIADVDVEKWRSVVSDKLRSDFNRVVATPIAQDRNQVFAQYRSIVSEQGEAKKGQAVFTEHCASCHQLGKLGYAIGPNLAAMRNRGAEAILMNVLAPNQEVNPQYVTYVATTDDGQVFSGVITNESATSITLSREKNQSDTILRVELDELTSTGKSLMPEGFEKQISRQAMKDLLAFILEASSPPKDVKP